MSGWAKGCSSSSTRRSTSPTQADGVGDAPLVEKTSSGGARDNLISLVWSDGDAALLCDYRLYNNDQDGLSKNDHFRHLLEKAHERGFQPGLVAFDSWYSSLENLKLVRDFTWDWLMRLKSNRQVSLKVGEQQVVSDLDIPPNGLVVHLRGYGIVKVFRTVDTHGNSEIYPHMNILET